MPEQQPAEQTLTADIAGRVAAHVLRGASSALFAASAVLGILVLGVWMNTDIHGDADFPGRYLLALLPMLAAAISLRAYDTDLEQAS